MPRSHNIAQCQSQGEPLQEEGAVPEGDDIHASGQLRWQSSNHWRGPEEAERCTACMLHLNHHTESYLLQLNSSQPYFGWVRWVLFCFFWKTRFSTRLFKQYTWESSWVVLHRETFFSVTCCLPFQKQWCGWCLTTWTRQRRGWEECPLVLADGQWQGWCLGDGLFVRWFGRWEEQCRSVASSSPYFFYYIDLISSYQRKFSWETSDIRTTSQSS